MATSRTKAAAPGKKDRKDGGDAAGVAFPDFAAFETCYAAGIPQVVYTRLVADLETPVSAYLKVADGRPMSFLLESVEGGATRGRYSVIGLAPDIVWRADGPKAEINRNALADDGAFKAEPAETLVSLRALLSESRIALPEGLPPMAAGVFGYMGYDTVRLIENLPAMTPDPLGVPDALLIRPTVMLIFDSVKDEMTVVTPVRADKNKKVSAREAYDAALARLADAVKRLDAPLPHSATARLDTAELPEPVSNTSEAEYLGMVAKAKEFIKAGDIFQVVLSQRFSAPFALPSFALYRALATSQPVAVSVSSRLRRLLARWLQSRNSRARPRRGSHHSPDRRHDAARGERSRGQGAR